MIPREYVVKHSPVFRLYCSICENMLYNIFFAMHYSYLFTIFATAIEDKCNGEDRHPTAIAAVSRVQP